MLEGIQELELDALDIAFHGGEALLYGIKEFDDLCNILITHLSSKVKLRLTIQTNGFLINEAWIALFKKHSVDVGISIDGLKEYNEKHRVDFFGRGSYDRLLKKIELLHKSSMRFGVLTVVNLDIGGKRFIVLLQMS